MSLTWTALFALGGVLGCRVTDNVLGIVGQARAGFGGSDDASESRGGAGDSITLGGGRPGIQPGEGNAPLSGGARGGVLGSGGDMTSVGLGGAAFPGREAASGRGGGAAAATTDGGRAPSTASGGAGSDALAGASDTGDGTAGAAGAADSGPPLVGGPCTALDTTIGSYIAYKTRTLAAPIPNVVGVAADATSLWLLSATHGNGLATVTRYALPVEKVVFQFQTRGFILEPGSDLYGIEVSTDTLYLSAAGPNWTDISTFDPTSGEPTDDFESPWAPDGVGPSDLALLDGTLLVSMGSGTLTSLEFSPLYKNEPFTSFEPDSGRDSGVATCNGVVLWGGLFEGITVLDVAGNAIGTVVQSDGQPFRQPALGALAFFGNQLVIAAPDTLAFYSLEPAP